MFSRFCQRSSDIASDCPFSANIVHIVNIVNIVNSVKIVVIASPTASIVSIFDIFQDPAKELSFYKRGVFVGYFTFSFSYDFSFPTEIVTCCDHLRNGTNCSLSRNTSTTQYRTQKGINNTVHGTSKNTTEHKAITKCDNVTR